MGKGRLECKRDCVICGSIGAICELKWIQGVWDDGVDVSHDQPFKTFNGYRCECYQSWVIVIRQVTMAFLGCFKHVGITDLVRDRLKMLVKTRECLVYSDPHSIFPKQQR